MAELTAEEIKELREKATKAEELAQENEALKKANEKQVSPAVIGTFKHKSVTYGFADGAKHTRLSNGAEVPSEGLLKLANGKPVSAEDLTKYPALAQIADEEGKPKGTIAKDYLIHLIEIGYGLIVQQSK